MKKSKGFLMLDCLLAVMITGIIVGVVTSIYQREFAFRNRTSQTNENFEEINKIYFEDAESIRYEEMYDLVLSY